MTTVIFHMEGERIVGFTVQGHSGYADEGSDIICAAVTSAVRLTECAVNDVLGLGASVKVRESDASIIMKIPGGLSEANETTCRPFWRLSWFTLPACTRSIPTISA